MQTSEMSQFFRDLDKKSMLEMQWDAVKVKEYELRKRNFSDNGRSLFLLSFFPSAKRCAPNTLFLISLPRNFIY